jgi:predicted ATPase
MRQGLVAHRATGAELQRPYFLSLLAEAYGKVGQPEEGMTVLVEALAIVDSTGECNWGAELHRRKGEFLLIQQGQKVREAEECFQQALDTARRQQAKSLELRAAMSLSQQAKSLELRSAMSLSRLWQQQGKQEDAHQLLSEIYGWFTEGFDTADLKEGRALLEELM